jgi:galactonate dehydratase
VKENNTLTRLLGAMEDKYETAYAHCDYPCGIYDPHLAQLSALTVVRMVDLMNAIPKPKPENPNELLDYVHDPPSFRVRDGYMAIPLGPGLGVTIDEERVKRAAQIGHRWRNPVWYQTDGSFAEW